MLVLIDTLQKNEKCSTFFISAKTEVEKLNDHLSVAFQPTSGRRLKRQSFDV